MNADRKDAVSVRDDEPLGTGVPSGAAGDEPSVAPPETAPDREQPLITLPDVVELPWEPFYLEPPD